MAVTAQFQPLDPGIVNGAIPAFFIGRNKEGFWVARDVNGQVGGIFLLENSALSFAKGNSRPAGCATIFPSERFELDLENRQSACHATWTVNAPCDAFSAANSRLHRQNGGIGQRPVKGFSHALN